MKDKSPNSLYTERYWANYDRIHDAPLNCTKRCILGDENDYLKRSLEVNYDEAAITKLNEK